MTTLTSLLYTQTQPGWRTLLASQVSQPYFAKLDSFVTAEYERAAVYPPRPEIFRALGACDVDAVQVVILGQDPYHAANQANGLAFSVSEHVSQPPSLRNIFKEVEADTRSPSIAAGTGNLEQWAQQGVLLLNATLTVGAGVAGSHQGKGWETFTDAVIEALSNEREGLVFLLWGNFAHHKGRHIDKEKHCVLIAAHPSPLAAHRGFFGCKHFSQANKYLVMHKKKEIKW